MLPPHDPAAEVAGADTIEAPTASAHLGDSPEIPKTQGETLSGQPAAHDRDD
jgi:hypothetical protein